MDITRFSRLTIWLIAVAMVATAGCFGPRDANSLNSTQLMLASTRAKSAAQDGEAAFLMLAGRLRYQIDKQVYPPVEQGGNSPGVLIAALASSLGQAVSPAIQSDPAAHALLLKRLGEWSPQFPVGYDPGWEYKTPLGKQAAARIASNTTKQLTSTLEQQARLLQDEEYLELKEQIARHAEVQRRYFANPGKASPELTAEFRESKAREKQAQLQMHQLNWRLNPELRWHARVGWKAEDFFKDPQAIELCRAIERDDLDEMRRLIDQGADVNAPGKDGMTLLLWALPDGKRDRFEMLLDAGADPNVLVASDFGTQRHSIEPGVRGGSLFSARCRLGDSVTHMTCSMDDTAYLRAVLAHGANAKLLTKGEYYRESPLGIVLNQRTSDWHERVELLLAAGANPSYSHKYGSYPVEEAMQQRDYRLVQTLLEAGAYLGRKDRKRRQPPYTPTLAHLVLQHEEHLPFADPRQGAEYAALVEWMEDHGTDFAAARADLDQEGPWGKQLRPYRDKGLNSRDALQQATADRRQAVIDRLRKNLKADRPPTAAERVAKLTPAQIAAIELPEEPDAEVFSLTRPSPIAQDKKEPEPYFVVYADGRCVAGHTTATTAPPAKGKLTRAELDWLLHLAIDGCQLLEQPPVDRANPPETSPFLTPRLSVAVESGGIEYWSTAFGASPKWEEFNRNDDPLQALMAYVYHLAGRTHAGGGEGLAKIVATVNLRVRDYNDHPLFRPWHLELARHDGRGLNATFRREVHLGGNRYEQFIADYRESGGRASVELRTRTSEK